jgi:hypothetical protein
MPDRPTYFRCPVCRSVSCERVSVKRPNGTTYVTMFYACATCTVMFLDPLAFTRGYEDRPRTPDQERRGQSFTEWSLINQARKDRGK